MKWIFLEFGNFNNKLHSIDIISTRRDASASRGRKLLHDLNNINNTCFDYSSAYKPSTILQSTAPADE